MNPTNSPFLLNFRVSGFMNTQLSWVFNRDINILIGPNNTGKSSLLRIIKSSIFPSGNDIDLIKQLNPDLKVELQSQCDSNLPSFLPSLETLTQSDINDFLLHHSEFVKETLNLKEVNYEMWGEGFKVLIKQLTLTLLQPIIFLENPESGLDINLQRQFIKLVQQLNPGKQIVIKTHSPTIFFHGYVENVFKIEDLITEHS